MFSLSKPASEAGGMRWGSVPPVAGPSSLPPRPSLPVSTPPFPAEKQTGIRAPPTAAPSVNQMWTPPALPSSPAMSAPRSAVNQMFIPPPPSLSMPSTIHQSVIQPFPSSLPPRPGVAASTYPRERCLSSTATKIVCHHGPTSVTQGKRKYIDDEPEPFEADSASSSGRSSSEVADVKPLIRASTVASERKNSLPVPVLPIPLPSKRYKKGQKSRGTLIPAEQLPTYPLPPLPTINDPELLKQVFTHSSLFAKPKGRFEDPVDAPAKHYEKLEHVGDSILGVVVTTWLHEEHPRLTCGAATKLKAHLVSNATLSHISGNYNFPQRLNGDPELLPVLRASTDVRAAMVEAYIAALYFSYPPKERRSTAMDVIDGWLREMYEPLMEFFYEYMSKEDEQHRLACEAGIDITVILLSEEQMEKIDTAATGMSNLVTMYCTKQDRELAWDYERYETNVGALWKVKCVVDGIELGDAVRASKKQAKNVAAWEGAKKLGVTPA